MKKEYNIPESVPKEILEFLQNFFKKTPKTNKPKVG